MDNTWRLAAECAFGSGKDIDFFSDSKRTQKKAQAVCREECPVQRECMEYALSTMQVHGVWGGSTDRELQMALGVDENHETKDWGEQLICPLCRSPWVRVLRKRRVRMTVECSTCELEWERRRIIRARRKRRTAE